MPGEATLFGLKRIAYTPFAPSGNPVLPEQSSEVGGYIPKSAGFWGWTNTAYPTTGRFYKPDLTTSTTTQTLVSASEVNTNMRCYVTGFSLSVLGPTAWASASTNANITLQDTAGNIVAYVPLIALGAFSTTLFPGSMTTVPELLGSGQTLTLSSYVASTGVLTFSGTAFVSGALANTPIQIVSGTGAGQCVMIASNTATTATVAANAFAVAPDSTSVFAVPYWSASSGSTTTAVLVNGGFTSNALGNGYSMVLVGGTGAGGIRPISTNTSTTPTIAPAYNTAPASGTIAQLTTNPTLNGAVDFGISNDFVSTAIGAGLVVSVNGTMSAGSSIRVGWQGYWSMT